MVVVEFVAGCVVGGAVVYVYKEYIQRKVEGILPGSPEDGLKGVVQEVKDKLDK